MDFPPDFPVSMMSFQAYQRGNRTPFTLPP